MDEGVVTFLEMDEYGEVKEKREIRTADILACRFVIIDAAHYRENGKCLCDDPDEQRRLIKDFEYTPEDFE